MSVLFSAVRIAEIDYHTFDKHLLQIVTLTNRAMSAQRSVADPRPDGCELQRELTTALYCSSGSVLTQKRFTGLMSAAECQMKHTRRTSATIGLYQPYSRGATRARSQKCGLVGRNAFAA